jgi:hypothetical protein
LTFGNNNQLYLRGQMTIQTSSTLGSGGIQYAPSILFRRLGANSPAGCALGVLRFVGFSSPSNATIEYGRITNFVKTLGSSLEDGRMLFQASVNSVLTDFLELDGSEEQINAYKPLDMNNNSIVSSTGDITLNASGSSGTGNINLTTTSTGGLIFTGTALQSGTSSGNSGQHLVITLNGTPYKIALQNV